MATIFTPTAPTFSTPITPASFSSSNTAGVGTTVQLDLTTKFGAWLHCRIGRTVATALTTANPPYIAIRRTVNDTLVNPANNYDFIGSTAAVNSTTITGSISIAGTTAALTSYTGFAVQQNCCLQLSGARIEFFEIGLVNGTTSITIDRSTGFRVAHNSSDNITNGADVGSIWIPGGDIWEISPVNSSGQTVIMGVDAAVYASDTGT